MRGQILWKIYLWFLVVVVGALYGASIREGLNVVRILDIPVTLISLAGVFGFAYRKSIWTSAFWKIWLPLVIVWDIFANFVWGGKSQMRDLGLIDIVFVAAVFYAVFLPGYIALFLYGFHSEKVWARTT